jgi:predicted O-methyltransferase YrrM
MKVKSDSKVWLENNQDQLFDFIYVDCYYSAEAIESDTRLSWPLLKVGGVMALDDVLFNEESSQAHNVFLETVKDTSTIIENGYQVWLRKLQ